MTGERTNGLEVRINNAGAVRCEPDWNWMPSAAAFRDYDLWYIWAGRGWMEFGDGPRHELEPGSVSCFRPDRPPRRAEHDRNNRLGVCFVHFDFLSRNGQTLRRVPDAAVPPIFSRINEGTTAGFFEITLRRVVELFHAGSPDARREAACYLRGLLHALRVPSRDRPDVGSALSSPAWADARRRLGEVVRHLRENPAETFGIEALAARAHYSVDHFSRLFAAVYGRTPKSFCIDVRLERARLLLTESDLTVDQIARNLGYADVFFFSRQFKGRVGLPPTAWRRATQGRVTST